MARMWSQWQLPAQEAGQCSAGMGVEGWGISQASTLGLTPPFTHSSAMGVY